MGMNYLRITYLLYLLFPFNLCSQVLKETLSMQGGSSTFGDSYVSFTIGQPMATGLYTNTNRILIQGFEYVLENINLKPDETSPFVENTLNVSIFPNPFQESLYIEGNDDIFPVNVYIFDMIGRLISSHVKILTYRSCQKYKRLQERYRHCLLYIGFPEKGWGKLKHSGYFQQKGKFHRVLD